MTNTSDRLTEQDVHRLLENPSAEVREETARKLAREFGEGELTPHERTIAEQIFRIMVKDAEMRVREALSANLKENPMVPHDVAVSLASDVDRVALPILEFSEVLTKDDLIVIIKGSDPEREHQKLAAMAKRKQVESEVADALVDKGDEEVVVTLVSNVGAQISETSLHKVVDKFGDSERVQTPLVQRKKLPVTVTERLVTKVSEKLKDHLLKHHDLPPDLATELLLQSRERATINLSTESTEDEVEQLVGQLKDTGRLTPSIIVRALCMGDMKFFEYAMAAYTGVPIINTRILIHDEGTLGLEGLIEKAGFPRHFYQVMRAAVDVSDELDYDGEEDDRERYSRRMIERVLTQYGDLGVEFESDDLEYLLTKMTQLPPTLHHEQSRAGAAS